MNIVNTTDKIKEDNSDETLPDPDATSPISRKLITQPYDLTIQTLYDQIQSNTLHLRPLSTKPKFQRGYVWNDQLASQLIESILLNCPIPPCYLSQSSDFDIEVIDGQQRIYSVYRFIRNQFKLTGLGVMKELSGLTHDQIDERLRKKLKNHVLRCVMVTNDSDPDIKFDVFERLNQNTVPLNPQELRNCIYRGNFIDMINELAFDETWLSVLGRRKPDPRMRGQELILRFFGFSLFGLEKYRTPQKFWLNDVAQKFQHSSAEDCERYTKAWADSLKLCVAIFGADTAFRRAETAFGRAGSVKKRLPINRALMDVNLWAASILGPALQAEAARARYLELHEQALRGTEFADLILRAVDHTKRAKRRFEIWQTDVVNKLK